MRELAATGLQRWPNDPQLTELKSQAARALVTSAMASRSAGDVGQARDLAKVAVELDPRDRAARVLLDQYEDELGQPGAGNLGAPRVLVDVPVGRTRPAQKAPLVARILMGGVAPRNAVNNPRYTIMGPGLPPSGTVLPAVGSPDGAEWRASFVPPQEGRYDVVFEANTEGVPLRAERELDVVH